MLVKLTPVVNFTNILYAHLRQYSSSNLKWKYIKASRKNFVPKCWWNWHLVANYVSLGVIVFFVFFTIGVGVKENEKLFSCHFLRRLLQFRFFFDFLQQFCIHPRRRWNLEMRKKISDKFSLKENWRDGQSNRWQVWINLILNLFFFMHVDPKSGSNFSKLLKGNFVRFS